MNMRNLLGREYQNRTLLMVATYHLHQYWTETDKTNNEEKHYLGVARL